MFGLIFNQLSTILDNEWLFIDGSIVRAHQHSTGAASPEPQGIGNTTKIHLVVDSGGLPVHFELSAGQVHDMAHAKSLVKEAPEATSITADKGYDSESLREYIKDTGAKPNIPRKNNSPKGNEEMDWCLYKWRHLVENAIARIKHFRAIATHYDKLQRNYASVLALAFSMMWLPMWVD